MNKKIHYIWLGKKEKSDIIYECIESWKKYFPDWEIVEWNEENLDIDKIRYCKEAYEEKKYAFVSDYFRFWILYEYGGLYFDTDVKVLKNFSKLIDKNQMFSGFENKKNVAPGLVLYSKNKGEKIFKEMLNAYEQESFKLDNGKLNLKTVVTRFTELLQKYGLKLNNTKQKIKNITVFPTEYFCPLDYETGKTNITINTYAIHLYNASWKTEKEKKEQEKYRYYYNKYNKKYKIKNLSKMISIYKTKGLKHLCYRILKKIKL